MADGHDAQAVVATHSPTLMRRVEPAQVRYLRLDEQRLTTVSTVTMPEKADPTRSSSVRRPVCTGTKTGWFLVPAD
jgi:predicted ATPase